MTKKVYEWMRQGGHFTSALLDYLLEPTTENLCAVEARHDSTNKIRFDRAREHWADLYIDGDYSKPVAFDLAMSEEWPLLGNIYQEVTHEEFNACFRNNP